MELNKYAQKVQEMRAAQRGYFSTPQNEPVLKRSYLDKSKALEREVDKLTSEILNPVPDNQISLF